MIPAEVDQAGADAILAWAGRDPARLHEAYAREQARAAGRHPTLAAALADRLGWPLPDTPPEIVLASLRRAGIVPAQVLDLELARPARWRRPELIAELRARGAAATTSISPVRSSDTPTGMFR
jgi:hypothetical protein